MSYWDTSTLVKLYAKESDSAAFDNRIANATTVPVTSRIALDEARATFRRKEAEGILAAGTAQTLYTALLQDLAAGSIRLVELSATVEQEYGQVLNLCYQQTPPLPLRTLDALHLASARVAAETEIVATAYACAMQRSCSDSLSSQPDKSFSRRSGSEVGSSLVTPMPRTMPPVIACKPPMKPTRFAGQS